MTIVGWMEQREIHDLPPNWRRVSLRTPSPRNCRCNMSDPTHRFFLQAIDPDYGCPVLEAMFIVNNLNGPAFIYRNDCPAPRIAVKLKGATANTHGIGARIKVDGGPVAQSQQIIAGGRYLSSDDTMRVFAAGNISNRLTIEVTWRSGGRSSRSSRLPRKRSPPTRRVCRFKICCSRRSPLRRPATGWGCGCKANPWCRAAAPCRRWCPSRGASATASPTAWPNSPKRSSNDQKRLRVQGESGM